MPITIEAVYEDGVLKPKQPLPLKEHEQVRVTVEPESNWAQRTKGIIPCTDARLIEQVALDKELECDQ